MIRKVKKFFSEVAVELKKVSWPNRRELMDATWLVMFSAFMLGLYIGSTDFVLSKLVGLLIK